LIEESDAFFDETLHLRVQCGLGVPGRHRRGSRTNLNSCREFQGGSVAMPRFGSRCLLVRDSNDVGVYVGGESAFLAILWLQFQPRQR
jgi:hypothetical protein